MVVTSRNSVDKNLMIGDRKRGDLRKIELGNEISVGTQ